MLRNFYLEDCKWECKEIEPQNALCLPVHYFYMNSHYDVFVKYSYVKAYCEKKDISFKRNLYVKMQNSRISQCNIDDFNGLIDSMSVKGFLRQYPIPITSDLQILNGAHRLACCLYFNLAPYVEIYDYRGHDYSREWFLNNGFNNHELACIDFAKAEFEEKNRNNGCFKGIIWNTGLKIKENILKYFIGKEGFKYKIICIGEMYGQLIEDVYKDEKWNEKKLENKKKFLLSEKPYYIIVFQWQLSNYNFFYDSQKKVIVNKEVDRLKQTIRSENREKIRNYFYDVLIHIADNFEENIELEKTFKRYKIKI